MHVLSVQLAASRWSKLFALLGCITAGFAMPSRAVAADAPVLSLVVKSPKTTYAWTVDSLQQALATIGTWLPQNDYEHAAKRLHVRNLTSATSVKRVGQQLGLTHVLCVTLRTKQDAGESRTFADIDLISVSTGSVVAHKSLFLPDRRLSASTAGFLADFLALKLHVVPPSENAQNSSNAQSADASAMHGRDLDDPPAMPPQEPSTPVSHGHHHAQKISSVIQKLLD